MPWSITVAVVAALLMAAVALLVARPSVEPPSPRTLLLGGIASIVATAAIGIAVGHRDPGFLISTSAVSAALLVPVLGLAHAAGLHGWRCRLVGLGWAVGVLPPALVLPQTVVDAVGEFRGIQDFGGALGLVVSAGAYVLVLSAPRSDGDVIGAPLATARIRILGLLGFWVVFAVWLAALEGAVDEYTPRILLGAIVAPAAGGAGWLLVDRLRGADRPLRRSIRFGALAGAAAVLSSVVAVPLGAIPLVGFTAGAIAAIVHDARRLREARVAIRTGVTALAAAASGLLASAVIGDQAGFAANANTQTFTSQVLAFGAVVVWALMVGAIVRVIVRLAPRTSRSRPARQ